MVVYGAFLVKKLLSNNIKARLRKCNRKKKCQKKRTTVDSLFEKANILSKSPASKICSNVKKCYNFLRQTLVGVHYAQCRIWFSEGLQGCINRGHNGFCLAVLKRFVVG